MRAYIEYGLLLLTVACGGEGRAPADSLASQPNAPAAPDSLVPERQSRAQQSILFVGTSLTAGLGLDPEDAYPAMIQRMIDSAGLGYDVINAGVSGETSSALLRRLDWLLRQPAGIIVIETGANDGLRGVPVETMRSNIQAIIDRIRATRPDARLALIQMEAPPNLGGAYTRGFREVFPELAAKNRIELLPFLLDSVAGHRELNQSDGIHPNLDGERIVARNVWRGLKPLLE
jgi:acyl-CoA thioesterase-1